MRWRSEPGVAVQQPLSPTVMVIAGSIPIVVYHLDYACIRRPCAMWTLPAQSGPSTSLSAAFSVLQGIEQPTQPRLQPAVLAGSRLCAQACRGITAGYTGGCCSAARLLRQARHASQRVLSIEHLCLPAGPPRLRRCPPGWSHHRGGARRVCARWARLRLAVALVSRALKVLQRKSWLLQVCTSAAAGQVMHP